jgi:predicted lipid-binding transport protein (Tim44 family)
MATAPPTTAAAPRPEPTTAARTEGAAGPVLKVLPLGSGLVLVGLGLALAFVGLRLRRGGA